MTRFDHLPDSKGLHDIAKRNRGLVGVARHPDALRGVGRQPQGPDQDLSIGGPWNRRFIPEKLFSGQFARRASVQNPLAVLTVGHGCPPTHCAPLSASSAPSLSSNGVLEIDLVARGVLQLALAHYGLPVADLVDTVRVEGDVILDPRHRFKWGLVGPHRIERAIPASRNAVIGSVALVGAIRRVFATRQRGHIDIPTGDVLNGRIGGLAKRQRIAGVCDHLSVDCDHDARRVPIDCNWMVRLRNPDRLVSHDLYPPELKTVPRHPKTASRQRRTTRDDFGNCPTSPKNPLALVAVLLV